VRPEPIQWATFYKNFKGLCGLDLNAYKQDQLQRRIISMVDTIGLQSLEEFWAYVKKDQKNQMWFLDKLAINVSELFRNVEKWIELEQKVLPELLSRSRTLKTWSAGCSYGAEAHSLAMILDRKFPGSHTIVGTDIDQAALTQARSGKFVDADVKGIPAEYKNAYLKQIDGWWMASANLQKYLKFKTGNLLSDVFESGFDLIMCRNVVIYFTEETKNSLYEKFFRALKPGGYLFVGSTERIINSREVGYEVTLPFYYRKPVQGEHVWRNAS
jgi:chemotaxis protein methyltransferase CheR